MRFHFLLLGLSSQSSSCSVNTSKAIVYDDEPRSRQRPLVNYTMLTTYFYSSLSSTFTTSSPIRRILTTKSLNRPRNLFHHKRRRRLDLHLVTSISSATTSSSTTTNLSYEYQRLLDIILRRFPLFPLKNPFFFLHKHDFPTCLSNNYPTSTA